MFLRAPWRGTCEIERNGKYHTYIYIYIFVCTFLGGETKKMFQWLNEVVKGGMKARRGCLRPGEVTKRSW